MTRQEALDYIEENVSCEIAFNLSSDSSDNGHDYDDQFIIDIAMSAKSWKNRVE